MIAGKLIAGFTEALISEGSTNIPNLLLRSYTRLGLQERELVLVLVLLYLRDKKSDWYPAPEEIGRIMMQDASRIEEDLASLIERKLLAIGKRYNAASDTMTPVYSLEGLFDQLVEIWAIEKAHELESSSIQNTGNNGSISEMPAQSGLIYQTFEREFGRPFSPMESQLIMEWTQRLPQNLILEALRVAVLNGTFNLRYIERILQDWQRKNIKTVEEVHRYEELFASQKMNKRGRKNNSTSLRK